MANTKSGHKIAHLPKSTFFVETMMETFYKNPSESSRAAALIAGVVGFTREARP